MKAMCRVADLPTSGTKLALLERLQQYARSLKEQNITYYDSKMYYNATTAPRSSSSSKAKYQPPPSTHTRNTTASAAAGAAASDPDEIDYRNVAFLAKRWNRNTNTKFNAESLADIIEGMLTASFSRSGARDNSKCQFSFDPATVDQAALRSCEPLWQDNVGEVLDEAWTKVAAKAVGLDGRFGDDESRGGGHYTQASRIESFLKGYRSADVRRRCRSTAAALLEALINGGEAGLQAELDRRKAAGSAGGLNGDLLLHLDDVAQLQLKRALPKAKDWEVSVDNLKDDEEDPKKAPERAAVVVKALRDRIFAAAGGEVLAERQSRSGDEANDSAANLRLLAKLIYIRDEQHIMQVLVEEIGQDRQRAKRFKDLVEASVEYASSEKGQYFDMTERQRTSALNTDALKVIQAVIKVLLVEWDA